MVVRQIFDTFWVYSTNLLILAQMKTIRTAYKLIHRPNNSADMAQVVLEDAEGEQLAYVNYYKESNHFVTKCLAELPAHFIHDMLYRSKALLLPQHSFRVRHTFSLLDRRQLDPDKYIWEQAPKDIWLTDDLLSLLYPGLNWIPFYYPGRSEKKDFFDTCATQELRHDGAPVLSKLLEHLIGMFSLGPSEILWTTGLTYPWSDDGTEEGTWYIEDGQPVRTVFERDESIECMEKVRDLCRKLAESEESFFIYHEGL